MESKDWEGPAYPAPPVVMWKTCPIATSVSILGRKWTLTVLRQIAFVPKASFAQIRKGNHGITARTLSLRLQELVRDDLIRKVVPADDPRHPYYELSERGQDVWPVLSALMEFGFRQRPEVVFSDGRRRSLVDEYPRDAGLLLGSLTAFARTADPAAGTTASSVATGRGRALSR